MATSATDIRFSNPLSGNFDDEDAAGSDVESGPSSESLTAVQSNESGAAHAGGTKRVLRLAEDSAKRAYKRFAHHHGHHVHTGHPNDLASVTAARLGRMLCPSHGRVMRDEAARGLRMVASFAAALEREGKRPAIYPRKSVEAALGGDGARTGESCRGSILRYVLPQALALADSQGGHLVMAKDFVKDCAKAMRQGTRSVRECRAEVRMQSVEERDRRKKEKSKLEKLTREREERRRKRHDKMNDISTALQNKRFRKKKVQAEYDALAEEDAQDARDEEASLNSRSPVACIASPRAVDHTAFHSTGSSGGGASQTAELQMLVAALEDPYLVHIVLPQLEAFLALFNIFDLRRQGRVYFDNLHSGLVSCCTPDVAIFRSPTTAQMVSDAAEIVSRVDRILTRSRQLLESLPVVFDAKDEFELDEAIRTAYSAIHESGVHVGGDVAALMKCLRSMKNDDRADNPQAFGHKGAEVLAQLASFRRRVDSILAEGQVFEQRNLYCSHRRSLINVLRRAIRRKLLLRRARLLSRMRLWDADCMKETVIYSKLKVLQRRARDRIAKRRPKSAMFGPGTTGKPASTGDLGDAEAALQVQYLAWPSVLIRFYSESSNQEREHSLFHVETLLRIASSDQNCVEPLDVAGLEDEQPLFTSHVDNTQETVFPVILLTGKQIALKTERLQSLLSNWNALTNLFDQSGSGHGNIKVTDLRCALMAMAELGLIAEPPITSHPLDERFRPVRRPSHSHKLSGKLHDYEFICGPRRALLLGTEPLDLKLFDAWALSVDFKCDPARATTEYSYHVLASCYRGGAIVARSILHEQQNDQLMLSFHFVPCDVFRKRESVLADMRRFVNGPLSDLYEIIKPMALPTDKWFTLMIQSEKLPGDPHQPSSRSIPKNRMRLGLRIDAAWDAADGDLPSSTDPIHFSYWSGSVDFNNVYSLGNSFDNVCSAPGSSVDWAIGPLRRFSVFRIDADWLLSDVAQKKTVHDLGWTRLRLIAVVHRANALKESRAYDLRHCVWKALYGREPGIFRNANGKAVVEGLYRIYGHASLGGRRNIVTMKNDYAVEHEKGLPVHHVVFRRDADLLNFKLLQLPELIRSFLGKSPIDQIDFQDDHRFWREIDNNSRLSFAPSVVFDMKGQAALDGPGLNSLGTAAQMREAINYMQRDVSTSLGRLRAVLLLIFFAPVSIVLWLITTESIRQKMHELGELAAVDVILLHIKRKRGWVPKVRTVLALITFWGLFAWTALVLFLNVGGYCYLDQVHPMELKLACGYYVWAALLLAIEVTTQVHGLPSEAPFRLAYKRAEMAVMNCTMINITNGQRFPCTGAGFLQMVSRLESSLERAETTGEDVDEGDLGGDDELLSLGRGLLTALWRQTSILDCLPWKGEDDQILDPILDFKVTSKPQTVGASLENNKVYIKGMVADFDIGSPSVKAEVSLFILAAVNSMLGYLHRLAFASEHLAGAKLRQNEAGGVNSCSTFTGSVLPSVATDFIIFTSCLTTLLASWICYRELFCSAFRWFMVLSVNKQLSAALAMDSAMARGLPCYLNLRDKGNLRAWYCVHEFLRLYGEKLVFGGKSQFTVVSSIIWLCMVAFNAIQAVFEGQTEADMSDPETLYSLYNVTVMCSMIMLALMALERLNSENEKLLKRLDIESLELLSQIESRVQDFSRKAEADMLEEEQLSQALDPLLETRHRLEREWVIFKRNLRPDGSGDMSREQVAAFDQLMQSVDAAMQVGDRSINLHYRHIMLTQGIVERHVLEDEHAYLQTIISKLRDQTDAKEIYGVTIDKSTISRIFTGIIGLLSILLKSTIDSLVATYFATVGGTTNATSTCLPVGELQRRGICEG
eukprot:COSAG02_NODE_1748_length_11073_cov_2.905040_1_plen_1842_part_00